MAKKTFGETLQGKPAEILTFALNQKVYIKLVGDYIDTVEEWQETWPCVLKDDGSVIRRRFVSDGKNTQPLIAAKKVANIPHNEENNWNIRTHRAVLCVVGTPQKIVKDGKKKTKIVWDRSSVKIWTFGVKAMRKIQSIRDNEELREEAEEKGYKDFASNLQVYAITVEKVPTGGDTRTNVDYEINASRLIEIGVDELEDYKDVEKKLETYASPSPENEIQNFIDTYITGEKSEAGAEAEAIDEDEEEPPKKSKKPADDDEEDETPKKSKKPADDDEDDETPKKSKKPADDDEEIEIEDVDIDEDDEKPKKSKKPVDDEDEEEPPKKSKKVVDDDDEDD